MKLTDFKALSFDCYGTLIDWESGMFEGLKPLTERVSHELTRCSRTRKTAHLSRNFAAAMR